MSWSAALPVLTIALSLGAGAIIFFLREEQVRLRTTLNLAAAAAKVLLVATMVRGAAGGVRYEARLAFMPQVELVLRADFLALLFGTLSAVLWLITTVYAIGYLEGAPHRSRFFGFFSLCVAATMGIALAGNLLTFFVFYELLTIVTYPLVVHRGTGASLAAGRTYLLYTLAGGSLVLVGAVWLHVLVGPTDFVHGGVLGGIAAERPDTLRVVFLVLAAGFGVKSALVPLHGWLPQAMVAPAPVSALLHAVAVVKAGAFGIVRLVYDVFGQDTAAALGVLAPLAAVASATILYGSVRAIMQDDLKRRLAFSTVSQLAYIALGVAIATPLATTGGLVHLIHQGIMKVTLFFCAGVIAETVGAHRVSEMAGIGRRLPLTMVAFTLAAFGMIGVPPTPGFVSKWYLGTGSLIAGEGWVVAVLAASSLLNAAYFLPIVRTAWFDEPSDAAWRERPPRPEARWALLGPPLVTATLVLGAGLLAGLWFAPLGLAVLAAQGIHGP